MLQGKGFKARALVGGWNAWLSSGGETEPGTAPANFEQPASYGKLPPTASPGNPPAKTAGPAAGTNTPAAKKTTTTKSKSKRRAKPRS